MENSSETKQNSPELIHGYFLLIFNFIIYSIPLHIWNNKYKYLILISAIILSSLVLNIGVFVEKVEEEEKERELEYAEEVQNGKPAEYGTTNGKLKAVRNPSETISTIIEQNFNTLIKPVNEAIEQQQEIAGELAGSVQSVRKMINYMRNSVSDGLHDSFNKLRNMSRRFITLMKKLFSIFNGIFQTLENNVLALTAVGETAASTINIFKPTLKLIGVFCFDENTILENGKCIKNIQLGDKLGNSFVKSVFKFDRYGNKMYNYHGVIVSGSHSVFEDNQWKRIRDTKDAKPINYKKPYIYCLETTSGEININNIRFKDYYESPNRKLQHKYYSLFKNYINKKSITTDINSDNCYSNSGFCRGSIIKCWSGYKFIENIKVGDTINGSRVIGIIKTFDPKIKLYKYKNIICSGYNVVFHNGKYHFVKDVGIFVSHASQPLYHLMTDDNRIIINDIEFRDLNIKLDNSIIEISEHYLEFNSNLESKINRTPKSIKAF